MGLTDLLLRIKALISPRRTEQELDEELRFHLDMQARKHQAAGAGPDAARRRAAVEFGGVEAVREECRDARGVSLVTDVGRDIRYGLRMLRKSPGFTAIAVLSLGAGIGANAGIFSLIDAVLYRMLPVSHPEQLTIMRWGASKSLDITSTWATSEGDRRGNWTIDVVTWPIFNELRKGARTLSGVIGFSPVARASLVVRGEASVTSGMFVSGNFFEMLGVKPLIGRLLESDDDAADGLPAVVIGYGMWDRQFGLNPGVIGQTLLVNKQRCIIVGVTRRGFTGVSPGGFHWAGKVDFMLPIRTVDRISGPVQGFSWLGSDLFWIQTIGRMRPGATAAAVSNDVASILGQNLPDRARRMLGADLPRIVLKPGAQGLSRLRDAYRRPLLLLLSVTGLTLLMACANLAGLLLARSSARRKEILVRIAVGARRGRLVRQLLVEGALLSAGGVLVGAIFAWWSVAALVGLSDGGVPILVDVRPDLRVLSFTAGVALAATFLFALVPAIRATRVDLMSGLKEETTSISDRGGPRLVQTLVGVQVAIAVLLVSGSLLFSRSLANLLSAPLGFNSERLLLFDLAPGRNGYDQARANQFYVQARQRLAGARGVLGASLAWSRLMTGGVSNGSIYVDGSKERTNALFNLIGPDYFNVMQIPLVMGRGIEQRDLDSTIQVAVVNETFARKHMGGGSPIGRRFRWERKGEASIEVVGVVKDSLYAWLRSDPEPTVYAPYTHSPFGWPESMSFAVRTAAGPAEANAEVRRVVRELDPTMPLIEPVTMEGQIRKGLYQERLFALLVSAFGALTVALACVGLYGMISWSVASRTREIGVRIALGASRATVVRMVFGQVWIIALAGMLAGVAAFLAVGRYIESQLYGIKPRDPWIIGLSGALVLAVAVLAAIAPVRRALRIDPVSALRYE
ncbi:MAG: ABC transporter permease [Acidobacteria bacterium]|nr:ABC transporter permease [Acidobacteriota bacterium]